MTGMSKAENHGRDARGRFAKGNPGGPGNPHGRRCAELRAAVLDAVGPDDLGEVVAEVLSSAKQGDLAAAKLLLERTLGKVPAVPADSGESQIELPCLATTADTVEAANAILAAMGEGRVTPEAAVKMTAVVELARRTIDTHELASRVAALEAECREAG